MEQKVGEFGEKDKDYQFPTIGRELKMKHWARTINDDDQQQQNISFTTREI